MELSERLTLLRKEQGLSQMELAQALDVSRQAVSRWEVGAAVPSTENLRMISKLYQVSFDYLVMGTEPQPAQPTQPPQPEQPRTEPTQETNKFSLREKIMLATALISIMLALISCVIAGTILYKESQRKPWENKPIPMEDMPKSQNDGYSEMTFEMIPVER